MSLHGNSGGGIFRERRPERPEPGLEALPLIESVLENRPAHLLRTGSAHAALGLVELQALRLERQPAEFENAPDIAFQIIDHFLVLHAQDPARQDPVPMRHQLDITAVIARYIVEAISEFLAGGEELLEIAEAAGHRLAPRIDDPGIGQDQVDETDMPEIIGVLVDEKRLAGAIDPGIGQVLLAEAAQLCPVTVRR